MNENFLRLKQLAIQEAEGHKRLSDDEVREAISACEMHADENTPNKVGRDNICVVHPYYLALGWNDGLAEIYGRKVDFTPLKNLEKLLRNVDRSGHNTILFDSHYHYIRKSHELVDEGFIDKVIFTDEDFGVPVHKEELNVFSGSEVNYLAGAIAYQCLDAVKHQIRKYAPFFSIRPIRDAILYHEPKFFTKLIGHLFLIRFLVERDRQNVNDIVFHIPSKAYSLIRGVTTDYLLNGH